MSLLPDALSLKLGIASMVGAVSTVLAFEFGAAELTAWSLIIGAFGVVISAIGVAIVSIMKGLAELRQKTEAVKVEVAGVSAHVDGMTTNRDAKIDSLHRENALLRDQHEKEMKLLREQLSEKKETAALLAQAVVQSVQPAPVALPSAAESSTVKNIETNTKDTADALKDQKP